MVLTALQVGKKWWATTLAVAGMLLAPVIIQAQNNEVPGSGFRVSPARSELTIERGESETVSIEVTNVTDTTVNATPLIHDFLADDDESGNPRIILDEGENAEASPYSIKRFVAPINKFSLAPGKEADVPVRITIPSNTAPGSYFGVVRFSSGNEDEVDNGNVGLSASVGSLILIQVPGDVTELLKVEEIGPASQSGGAIASFFDKAPKTMVTRVHNEGNTFIKPFGRIQIKNWSGKLVHEYELNSTEPRGNVLPGSTRRFENELKGVGRFGRYTVEANVSYGSGGNIITVRETFWVIPWKMLAVVAVVLVALGLAGARALRNRNYRRR